MDGRNSTYSIRQYPYPVSYTHLLGPIKNKPAYVDGRIICPSSTEGDGGWRIHFEISDDKGKTWKMVGCLLYTSITFLIGFIAMLLYFLAGAESENVYSLAEWQTGGVRGGTLPEA